MTKKDFIALADAIMEHDDQDFSVKFHVDHLATLGDFCARQNPRFDYGLWLDYINGKCGPNGGKLK